MATKKSAKTTKKPAAKKPAASAAKTTTKVTTLKATDSKSNAKAKKPVAAKSTSSSAAAATVAPRERFSFSRSPLLAASLAEFLGAFLLGSFFLVTQGTPLYILFGMIVLVVTFGLVSGAHLNPAVTIGAWATRRVNSVRALSYVVAQFLGAMLALVVVSAFVNAAPDVSAQAQQLGQSSVEIFKLAALPDGKEWLFVATELVGAIVVTMGFAAVARERSRLMAAFGVGGALFFALTISGTLDQYIGGTVAVLNPAIAASVQGISWSLMPILVYVVAPVVGGIIGFGLQDMLQVESE